MSHVIIFVRHGEDGQSAKVHDPHLSPNAKSEVKKKCKKLVKKYGIPDIIISSPYRRTIETGKIFSDTIKKHSSSSSGKDLKRKIDKRVSRYFTTDQQKEPLVSQETMRFQVPIIESKEEFLERIKSHMEAVKKIALASDSDIWVITHGLVMKRIAGFLEEETPEMVPYLHHIAWKI